jgi:hypothetical protein
MLRKTEGKLVRKALIFAILFAGFAFAGAGIASAQTGSAAGEWDAAMNTPGGTSNFKLVFKVDGEKLTGTVKRASGDVPLEGTIKGQDLDFSYTIEYGGHSLTMSLTGKWSGDSISGLVFFGESGQSSDWTAKRAAKP